MPRATKTHCNKGHAYVEGSYSVSPKGHKTCHQCRKEYADKYLFGGLKERVIARDGSKCVKCGITREQHKKKFNLDITIDHIDGQGSRKPREVKNNKLENLQTLCSSCHGRKDTPLVTKLTAEDVMDIRMFHEKGIRNFEIHRCYQMMHPTTIRDILDRRSWRWLAPQAQKENKDV